MKNKIVLVLLVLTILVYYSIYLIWLPKGVIFNTDEVGLFYDVIYRFNGIPPEYSAWPGGSIQFFDYAIVLFVVGIKTIANGPSVSTFTKILAEAMNNPDQYLSIFRFFNVLIFVSVLGYLVKIVQSRLTTNALLLISCVVLVFAFNSTITLYHFTATSESLALSSSLFALGLLKFSKNKNKIFYSAIAIGISLASKITFGILIIYILYLIFDEYKSLKMILIYVVIVGLSFMFFCPYIWTDTIRIIKSILGNLARSGQSIGYNSAFTLFAKTTGVLMVILFFISLIIGKTKSIWKEFAICIVSVLLIISSLAKSSIAFDRYLLPALIVIFIYIIGRILETKEFLEQNKKAIYTIFVLSVFQVGFGVNHSYNKIRPNILKYEELTQIEEIVKNNQGEKSIIVPYGLMSNLIKYANKKSILEWHNKLLCDKKDIQFFIKAGIDSSSYQVLYNSLSDQEIGLAYRLKVFSAYSKGKSDMKFYSFNEIQESRYGLHSLKNFNTQNSLFIIESDKVVQISSDKIYQKVYTGNSYSILRFGNQFEK